MTDREVEEAVREICAQCQGHALTQSANADVERQIREKLGYEGTVSVSSHAYPPLGDPRFFNVEIAGPQGHSLQIQS